jgi:hypothetical protein
MGFGFMQIPHRDFVCLGSFSIIAFGHVPYACCLGCKFCYQIAQSAHKWHGLWLLNNFGMALIMSRCNSPRTLVNSVCEVVCVVLRMTRSRRSFYGQQCAQRTTAQYCRAGFPFSVNVFQLSLSIELLRVPVLRLPS